MAERRVEQIKYEIELLRLTTLATLAIGGGSIGLILGDVTLVRTGLAVLGVLLAVGLGLTLWRLHRVIGRQIIALEEERVWKR